MSYDMRVSVMKRKVIQDAMKELGVSDLTDDFFSELFDQYLYMYLYPEEYGIPSGLEGREICSSQHNVLKGIRDLPNDAVVMLKEEDFSKLCDDIRTNLRETRLIDLINRSDHEISTKFDLIGIYKTLMSEHIDWETEVIVFDHSW